MILGITTVERPGTMYEPAVIDKSLSKADRHRAAARRYYERHRDEILATHHSKRYRERAAENRRLRMQDPAYRERQNRLDRERRLRNPEPFREKGRAYYWRKKYERV